FFQAEDGIRDFHVTGVQTCALPIWARTRVPRRVMKGSMDRSEIVVGLDIGTTKVSAVVGEVDAEGITILGVGNVPCRGLRKGVRAEERRVGKVRSGGPAADDDGRHG